MKVSYFFVCILVVLLVACGAQPVDEPETGDNPTETEVVTSTENGESDVEDEDEGKDTAEDTSAKESNQTEETNPVPEESEPAEVKMSDEMKVDFPAEKMTTTDSGLQYLIEVEGSGAQAQAGDRVQVHYTGRTADGNTFDSSIPRNEPFVFVLGQGQVIRGWDEGIALLTVGSKAKLVIPPDLGYGARGAGASIPPNATLYFEVELLDIMASSPAAPAEVDEADYTVTESGLKYYDFEVGDGEESATETKIAVHYTGWLEDGTKFDSSIDRGSPFRFVLGRSQVIPGWDEGVTGMQIGGKRQLFIPSELGYGERGAGGVIPPGANLIFEIELLEVAPAPPGAPSAPEEVAEADFTTTESGLKYYDFEVGEGNVPEAGQQVTVHYTGWLEDGTKFDSSLDRGEEAKFIIGVGRVIPGWDEGLLSMKPGGKRQLVIPSELGYGEQGAGGVIPPNATLIFEVELISVE